MLYFNRTDVSEGTDVNQVDQKSMIFVTIGIS